MKKKNPCHHHRLGKSESIITICSVGEIVKGCNLRPQECKKPCMSGSITSVPRVSSHRLIELAARNVSRVGEMLDVVEKLSELSDDSTLGEEVQNQLRGIFLLTFSLAKELKSEGPELIYNLFFEYLGNTPDNSNLSDSDLNG